jgi:uncharacterized SAM-binding protein YcdF (DUF218 family)
MIDALLHPVGWIWLALGVFGLRGWIRGDTLAAIGGLGLMAVLTVGGGTPFPSWWLARMERPFLARTAAQATQADAILMLGGGHRVGVRESQGLDAGEAFDRALAVVELVRAGQAKTVILGGGRALGQPPGTPESEVLATWLRDLLPAETRVIVLPASRNTWDEAVHFHQLRASENWRRLLLVSSASHLRRALPLFKVRDLEVTPVACDFVGNNTVRDPRRWSVVPRVTTLYILQLAMHETIGELWYRHRLSRESVLPEW